MKWPPWARRQAIVSPETALQRAFDRIERLESAPPPDLDLVPLRARLEGLEANLARQQAITDDHQEALTALAAQAKDFVIALAEGIERTDRAERRIKATVARARKELEARGYSDPGLDSEAHELREVHGNGGAQGGLQPVREEVAGADRQASSVEGVPLDVLRRVRGL